MKKKVDFLSPETIAKMEEREIANMVRFLPEPTYRFSVGDEVAYGAMKLAIVKEVLEDGKIYRLECVSVNNNKYGDQIEKRVTHIVNWLSIRPKTGICDTKFCKNRHLFTFANTSVESLLRRIYGFGVNMDPDYQRGYVWKVKDKEYLIDSIFNGIDIGKFVFAEMPWNTENNFTYEIVDGKQRLSAMKDFFENRFTYQGLFYNELSGYDKYYFKNYSVSYADIDGSNRKNVYQTFLTMNRCGKRMGEKDLEKAKQLLEEENGISE